MSRKLENSRKPVEPDAMGGKPDKNGDYPTYSPVTGLEDGTYELDANGAPVPIEKRKPVSGSEFWRRLRDMF